MRYRPPRNKWGADFAEDYERNLEDIERDITGVEEIVEGSKTNAEQALTFATEAKGKAESVQAQFNQVVIEGDSSVEAAQARVDAKNVAQPTLKARLDKDYNEVTAQLAESILESVQYDGGIFTYQVYRALQLKNMTSLLEKIKRNLGFTIVCRGDSLTYGEDNVVEKRAADITPTHSGRTHISLRANTSYPEALQEYLSLAKNDVTVINQGYSGDNTKKGFEDWTNDVGANLSLIMYGTNDAAIGFAPYQTIENYIFYYEKIIIRELLRGSAVILMKPPKLKKIDNTHLYIETYREAVNELGKKYGIEVLDCTEFLMNDDSAIFADATHFKSLGYRKIASKISAYLLGNVSKPVKVKRGSTLLTREEFDGISFKGYSIAMADIGAMTPPLDSWQGGYVAKTSDGNSVFIWSFYAEEDDLIVIPTVYVSRCIARYELDFGLEQPQYSLDDKVGKTTLSSQNGTTEKPLSYLEIDSGVNTQLHANRELNRGFIHIATKGWHTIKLTVKLNGTNTNPFITNQGLSFMGYEEYNLWYNYFKKFKGYYYGLTHNTWSPAPISVSSTAIRRQDILDNLKLDETNTEPFKNSTLKITIESYDKGVVEYIWKMGSIIDNAKNQLIERDIVLYGSASESELRKIDAINYSNGIYTITWIGKIDAISTLIIKLN